MSKEYKYSRLSSWKYFYRIIITTFSIHAVATYFFISYKKINDDKLMLFIYSIVFLGWFIFFTLPLILLYFNHRFNNNILKFIINDKGLIFETKKDKFNITFTEILKVELYLSPPSYSNRIDFLYFGKYHFTTIYTKDNQVIDVSCLVFDKSKEFFPGELIVKKKKNFPFINKNR